MKRCWPLLILGVLLLMPGVASADITYNPVYGAYQVTQDEYGITVPAGTTGIQSFGGKFINPQGKNFLTVTVYSKRAFGVTNYLKVTFGDGHVETFNSFESGSTQIPSAYWTDHPSKGVTFSFYSDGAKDHVVFLSAYGLVDDDGTSPTTPPAATATPAPTVKPTAAPTVKPTTTPAGTTSPNPTAGATATATAQPSSSPGTTDPGDGETEEPECTAACQTLIDQLECPQWGEYMGEWANMISSALPPPPDWDMVADKIGAATLNYISGWAGDVPEPPTMGEIENATAAGLPGLDTSVETDDLVPKVPSDYNNGKIVFDLSQGAPKIEVKDESQPFVIEDPLAEMPHDDPGVKVLPGDPRNSTGGFKEPDKVDTGDPAPTPGKIVFDLPIPSAPIPAATTGPPPTPGKIVFDLPPIPGITSSVVPTLGTVDGIIPVPKGGE